MESLEKRLEFNYPPPPTTHHPPTHTHTHTTHIHIYMYFEPAVVVVGGWWVGGFKVVHNG